MQYSLRKRCHAHKKVDVSTQFLGCHFSLREDYIFFRRFLFTALLIFTSFIWLYTVRFNMRSRVRGAGVSGVSVWDNGGDWFYRWSQSNVFTHRHLLLVQIVRRCTSCRYCYFALFSWLTDIYRRFFHLRDVEEARQRPTELPFRKRIPCSSMIHAMRPTGNCLF